jgi:hypothetical protein
MKPLRALIAVFGVAAALSLPGPALAQTDAEMKRMDELDRVCEAAREKKLAPLRAERIERCVRDERRPRADCETEYAHWGDTRTTAGGRARAGLYYDLPECVEAFKAREHYRR